MRYVVCHRVSLAADRIFMSTKFFGSSKRRTYRNQSGVQFDWARLTELSQLLKIVQDKIFVGLENSEGRIYFRIDVVC